MPKQKTKRAAMKRFKRTKKTRKRKNRLKKASVVSSADFPRVNRLLQA
jgi:ribosomal protein L35